jgi:hypothetical protein
MISLYANLDDLTRFVNCYMANTVETAASTVELARTAINYETIKLLMPVYKKSI